MRELFLIGLAIFSLSATVVSKQDIQNCQKPGKSELVDQCVRLLKINTQRRQEIECKKDLNWWVTYNHSNAQNNCAVAFNRASRLDQRWTRIWNDQKLSHARWLSKKKSSITYFTDKDDIRLE